VKNCNRRQTRQPSVSGIIVLLVNGQRLTLVFRRTGCEPLLFNDNSFLSSCQQTTSILVSCYARCSSKLET
jgi:hypothetical protein